MINKIVAETDARSYALCILELVNVLVFARFGILIRLELDHERKDRFSFKSNRLSAIRYERIGIILIDELMRTVHRVNGYFDIIRISRLLRQGRVFYLLIGINRDLTALGLAFA